VAEAHVSAFGAGHRAGTGGFLALLAGLVALAWLALWVWSGSPYGRYLDHGGWTQIGLAGAICRAVPGAEVAFPLLVHVGGWVLMSAAMMLPTTAPLLAIYRRLAARRNDRRLLLLLVVAGYLAAWSVFGVAAHLMDAALQSLVQQSLWLMLNGWAVGAAVLALAGLFQFSALKHHCLDRCRSPFSFAVEAWRGPAPRVQALRLGWRHGVFCVGCCWALMLLMFVVGMGNLGWMLLLAAVMAAEKNLPWGRRLSAPVGVALLAGGAAMAFVALVPSTT
jgi:predicted metal-binding membrane protein